MANTNKTARLKVVEVNMLQGDLYEVWGEDEKLTVFDTTVHCRTADGREWTHNAFVVKGFAQGPDGCYPNRNWKKEAMILVEMIQRFGDMNPKLWTLYAAPSYIANEAYNLRCEQDEREQKGY